LDSQREVKIMHTDYTHETCKKCNGTGKINSLLRCRRCKGIGKEPFKSNERPLTCHYCINSGVCTRCYGTKQQKKFRIAGSKVSYKKCKGSGICPTCRDAPNGGYYMVWCLSKFAHSYVPHHGKMIDDTYDRIIEVKKRYEKIKSNFKNTLSFEDFAKYPPYNEIRQGPGSFNFKWETLCGNIKSELDRYDVYLKQFED
jgi:hypothetical protein